MEVFSKQIDKCRQHEPHADSSTKDAEQHHSQRNHVVLYQT